MTARPGAARRAPLADLLDAVEALCNELEPQWKNRPVRELLAKVRALASGPDALPPMENRSDAYYSLAAKWELDAAALELNHGPTKAMVGATALRACAKELLEVGARSLTGDT